MVYLCEAGRFTLLQLSQKGERHYAWIEYCTTFVGQYIYCNTLDDRREGSGSGNGPFDYWPKNPCDCQDKISN